MSLTLYLHPERVEPDRMTGNLAETVRMRFLMTSDANDVFLFLDDTMAIGLFHELGVILRLNHFVAPDPPVAADDPPGVSSRKKRTHEDGTAWLTSSQLDAAVECLARTITMPACPSKMPAINDRILDVLHAWECTHG